MIYTTLQDTLCSLSFPVMKYNFFPCYTNAYFYLPDPSGERVYYLRDIPLTRDIVYFSFMLFQVRRGELLQAVLKPLVDVCLENITSYTIDKLCVDVVVEVLLKFTDLHVKYNIFSDFC